jgi:hypothetical protein
MKSENIMKKLFLFLFITTILLFVTGEISASCPIIVQHPPCVEFWRADAVFTASAVEVQIKPQRFLGVPPPIVARLKIEEIFKGIEEKEIVLDLEHCGYQFKQGEKYLIYAHRRDHKLNVRIGATRTKPLSQASDDLDYLRSLQRGEPQAQIVGKIGQQTSEIKRKHDSLLDQDWHFFGAPIAGIKVFAKGAEQIYETVADEKGEYKFFGLPSGEYEVWADYPLYFESRKETVKTTAKGCGIGNLTAHRKGSIGGRVTDAGGAPAKYVRLSLVSADASPQEIFEERENDSVWYLAATDEKGEYRFVYLPAGHYYVIINRTDFERSRETEHRNIPRMFYPNAKNIKDAKIISITEGEQISGKDFRLPKIN